MIASVFIITEKFYSECVPHVRRYGKYGERVKIMGYEPLKVTGERVWRTYIGGREIERLHGADRPEDSHFPEEWMYSVTQAVNVGREGITEGICRVDGGSGITLRDVIEEYPQDMLGESHVKRWGATPGVLIKIIDSKERLTVQVHPDKRKARELFHSRFGKTECWYILGTRKDAEEPPCIYLGFKTGITRERWEACFRLQDYGAMLALLNRIEVKPGEVYLVKGGVPHAIGAGCMIVEIQEPTDYTIRVEKVTPSGYEIDDRMCHQGLGFERMFDCFSYEGLSEEQVKERSRIEPQKLEWEQGNRYSLVDYSHTECFRIERLEIVDCCEWAAEYENHSATACIFCCLYVLSGTGILKTGTREYQIGKNDQFFVPAKTGNFCIRSAGDEPVILLKMNGPA